MERNSSLHHAIDEDFKDRLRNYELACDQLEDRECGEFYGIYHNDSKKVKSIQYPLIYFDKEAVIGIPEIFAPVKVQIKPPTR